MLRLAACLGIPIDIIEPCGFVFDDRRLKRVGLDYLSHVRLTRHRSWDEFQARHRGRLILLTTKGDRPYVSFEFRPNDTILVGRESAGVPQAVHEAADVRLVVPMVADARSLNVAQAASMALGEALRQTKGFPAIQADTTTAPTER